MRLVYSPDDSGYYWERFSDWKTSRVFPTKEAAERARTQNKLKLS